MTKSSKRLHRPTRGVLALHLLMIGLIVLPYPVAPATITVNGQTTDAPGTCDLVEAIENAEDDAATNADCAAGSGDDEIVLTGNVILVASDDGNPNDGTGTPRIDGGATGTSGSITIQGNNFIISRDPASSDNFRLFSISAMGNLTLNDVTVTGGLISATARDSLGGGIFNNRGTLALSNSTISGNIASASNNYPYAYGGGIYNLGDLTITDSTISDNRAEAIGIASSTLGYAKGGGISNCSGLCAGSANPSLIITSSTVSGNTAEVTTMDPNLAPSAFGGGVYVPAGTSTITNSTISGNTSTVTGTDYPGAYGGGIEVSDGDLLLYNTTISSNAVSAETGIYPYEGAAGLEYFGFGGGSVGIYESILGNHGGDKNCVGITDNEDGGNNLSDDLTCGDPTIFPNLTNLSPTLADNGGPTETHALLDGSTAIDAAGTCGLAFDQRGVARPADACDSGSYELVGCQAADGDTEDIPDGTMISTEVTIETCSSITAGDVDVFGTGHLILRTAGTVQISDGFEVDGVDASLTVENDGTIVVPDRQ